MRFDMDYVRSGTQPQAVASLVSAFPVFVFVRYLTGTAISAIPGRLESFPDEQQLELLTDYHV
jgi:hypothetical protein